MKRRLERKTLVRHRKLCRIILHIEHFPSNEQNIEVFQKRVKRATCIFVENLYIESTHSSRKTLLTDNYQRLTVVSSRGMHSN